MRLLARRHLMINLNLYCCDLGPVTACCCNLPVYIPVNNQVLSANIINNRLKLKAQSLTFIKQNTEQMELKSLYL